MEAYSNPIDVLNQQQLQQQHHQQRQQNGTLTNGSLTRDGGNSVAGVVGAVRHKSNNGNGFAYALDNVHSREDDIYTLPVDSCRPAASTSNQRPASLIIGAEAVAGQQQQHNSMTRFAFFRIWYISCAFYLLLCVFFP